MNKKNLATAVLLMVTAFVAVLAGTVAYRTTRPHTPSAPLVAPPAGALQPNADWLAQYDAYKALLNDVQDKQQKLNNDARIKGMQEESDRGVGMAQRLQSAMPRGYLFDEKSRYFVPQTPPSPVPPGPPAPSK
jgi:hypothetical protein